MRYLCSAVRYLPFSILCVILLITSACSSSSAEEALSRFYSNNGPEETLMDPLILAGDKVAPLVITSVKDRNMPKRRYAIGFLGNGAYRDALPILEYIVGDVTERDVIRGDALISIYLIDASLGEKHAEKFKNEPTNLGKVSKDISSKSIILPQKRSYFSALASRHNN